VADRIGFSEEMVIAVDIYVGSNVEIHLAGIVVAIAAGIDWLGAGYYQVQAFACGY
jgi:hypothetical protein